MKRILLAISLIFCISIFSNAQGTDCSTANPFCTGNTYNYPAGVNVPNLGAVGCLGSSPNPAWYYLQIANSGDLTIHIASTSGVDVDFICWGPYSSLSAACATNLITNNSSVDCSYSTAATEDCTIPNAQTGEIYVLLITNYANVATNEEFSQTGGTGSTDCSIVAPPITGDTVCEGETINLTVNNPTAGATYSWTGPGGFASNVMDPTIPGATLAMSGIYSMTITLNGQVSAPVTCTVLVAPLPTITISPPNAQVCAGSSVVLTPNCSTGSGWYTWDNGDQGAGAITVTPSTTTTYNVTCSDTYGCTGTASVIVTIASNLTITATANPANICQGQSSVISAVGGLNYDWQPGSMTGDSTTVTPPTTTVYSVSSTDANGCTGSTTVTVNVMSNVFPNAIANPATICTGQSSVLTASGAINYSWEPGTLSGSNVTVTPATTTTYTLTGEANGCEGTTTVTVTVTVPPLVVIAADIYEGCEDLLVHFSDLTGDLTGPWFWDFGDNSYSFVQNPTHLYIDPGTYDVSLTINSSSPCLATTTWPAMIYVYKRPYAYFTANPEHVSELDPTIFFNNQSINSVGWNWYFGDTNNINNNSNAQNPIHVYSDTGAYTVTLIVISDHGCLDTIHQTVHVEPNVSFYVPNAFTPNDDSKNPTFTMKGEGIDWNTFVMRIYDRWGKILFYTNDHEMGWDGKTKGKKVEPGIYPYTISFTDIKLKEHSLKGTVVLIK